jgi:hypothetical protein
MGILIIVFKGGFLHKRAAFLAAVASVLVMLAYAPALSSASYTIEGVNVTVVFNSTTNAHVNEIFQVFVSNTSMNQYSTARVAFNLTLSKWQQLVGSGLVPHIINQRSGIYNFRLLPGPVRNVYDGGIAYIEMSYDVHGVASVKQTSPREFTYTFNDSVFNFEHAASGEVLGTNMTLNIDIPKGAVITSAYPVPDYPAAAFTSDYTNVTELSWFKGEPLSNFALVFNQQQSLEDEVISFFNGVYNALGVFVYVIIIALIVLIAAYAYYRTNS